MLHLLDKFYTVLHLLIIGFNLLGWIWPKTRRAHFISILLTAGSWFLLGIWFGWGYCPITDWQWQVKKKLGENRLPVSFIEYYGEKITGLSLDTDLVNMLTLIVFLLAALLSVYLNFFNKRSRDK